MNARRIIIVLYRMYTHYNCNIGEFSALICLLYSSWPHSAGHHVGRVACTSTVSPPAFICSCAPSLSAEDSRSSPRPLSPSAATTLPAGLPVDASVTSAPTHEGAARGRGKGGVISGRMVMKGEGYGNMTRGCGNGRGTGEGIVIGGGNEGAYTQKGSRCGLPVAVGEKPLSLPFSNKSYRSAMRRVQPEAHSARPGAD